ncbi:predicted protein [Lichtheimia corymbifera JMRC:FSU:9682]|uniref:Uncharacterized protein n=1 Tax=Lichtheimia corymbifera JMRC:FSU:9682 TaxID=1263082 RepID=A0A068S151_9FUNG|nr:predicted protein [Lichtheimia corymbifera JMRC:FSU:9682]
MRMTKTINLAQALSFHFIGGEADADDKDYQLGTSPLFHFIGGEADADDKTIKLAQILSSILVVEPMRMTRLSSCYQATSDMEPPLCQERNHMESRACQRCNPIIQPNQKENGINHITTQQQYHKKSTSAKTYQSKGSSHIIPRTTVLDLPATKASCTKKALSMEQITISFSEQGQKESGEGAGLHVRPCGRKESGEGAGLHVRPCGRKESGEGAGLHVRPETRKNKEPDYKQKSRNKKSFVREDEVPH